MSDRNPLFKAHMLLLRWGEERLAAKAEAAGDAIPAGANSDGAALTPVDVPTLPNSRYLFI